MAIAPVVHVAVVLDKWTLIYLGAGARWGLALRSELGLQLACYGLVESKAAGLCETLNAKQ